MNVERLLGIIDALLDASSKTGLEQKVANVVEALQNIVNEPGNPNYPQQLAQYLANLSEVAKTDTLAEYPVVAREAIEEFALFFLVSSETEKRIRTLIHTNAATPSVALAGVIELLKDIRSDLSALRNIRDGLKRFTSVTDKIGATKSDISFIIPRGNESVPTGQLISDIKDFEFIENAFERLVTGRQTGAKVRSLASSD